MEKAICKDYDNVFNTCIGICQNCPYCLQKYPISPSKPTKTNKNVQNVTKFYDRCPCKIASILAQTAKTNSALAKTNFERVKFFYVVQLFLEQNCAGKMLEAYTHKMEHEWAQVVLSTYNTIPNICKMIEGLVDELALARSLDLGLNKHNQNTFKQVDNILTYLDRKQRMENMHIKASRAFAELSKKSKEILEMRFFERKTALEAAEKLQITLRSSQRRTEKALDEFVPLMKNFGLDAKNILFEIGKFEPWMLEWFRPNSLV